MSVAPRSLQKILVTGGAGFIGSHLVRHLVAEGRQVVVLDDLSSGRLERLHDLDGRFVFHAGDVRDLDGIQGVVEDCEAVVHLAAEPSVKKSVDDPFHTHSINYGGTLAVAEAARLAGGRKIIFASSAAVYGSARAGVAEGDPVIPLSPYGLDKLASEQLLRIYGSLYQLPSVSLRFFNVYGPGQDPHSPYSGVISKFVQGALSGKGITIFGDGLQTRDYVSVHDLTRVVSHFLTSQPSEEAVFNVARGEGTTLLDLHRLLTQRIGDEIPIQFAPARSGDIRESVADVSALCKAVGWIPETRLEEGLGSVVLAHH
ncbi:MAG: SDR family NAD(P)-dependent oxidoreductase [Fimbriimonadaceae bacterium]|jgi:UDP-glucose 4-epimerase|nr:SDR family NAD(P)-dependent oxidoreductase [Fimbriimonadaceae bacterium]